MRRSLITALVVGLAGPVGAETVAADCARLIAPLEDIEGYVFAAPAAAMDGPWCVFDGATLRTKAADRPNFQASRLRLEGVLDGNDLVELSMDMAGFKVLPKAGDRKMDDRLRSLFRLQTATISGRASVNRQVGQLELRDLMIQLQDGMELRLDADIQGAGLELAGLMVGNLTRLDLDLRSDGRFLRPLMEMAGERIDPSATGTVAVDAARVAVGEVVAALPTAILTDDAGDELAQLVAALPQGRGRLILALKSNTGIGAARVAIAALSDAPLGAESLGRLLAGSVISVDWQPGLTP